MATTTVRESRSSSTCAVYSGYFIVVTFWSLPSSFGSQTTVFFSSLIQSHYLFKFHHRLKIVDPFFFFFFSYNLFLLFTIFFVFEKNLAINISLRILSLFVSPHSLCFFFFFLFITSIIFFFSLVILNKRLFIFIDAFSLLYLFILYQVSQFFIFIFQVKVSLNLLSDKCLPR